MNSAASQVLGSATVDIGWSSTPSEMIPGHLGNVAAQAKQLHETFEELRSRLAPVLGPEGKDVAGELAEVRSECSPIAEQLADTRSVLASLDRRLRVLIERVEL